MSKMSMLYSFNMNFRPSSKLPEKNTDTGISPEISIFLQELSPFGLFLTQIIHMAGWFFPGNKLPSGLQSVVDRLEEPNRDQKDIRGSEFDG